MRLPNLPCPKRQKIRKRKKGYVPIGSCGWACLKNKKEKKRRKEKRWKKGGNLVEEASWDCIGSELRICLFSEGKGQKSRDWGSAILTDEEFCRLSFLSLLAQALGDHVIILFQLPKLPLLLYSLLFLDQIIFITKRFLSLQNYS